MNVSVNPFQQLYFSDDTQSENNFVDLFSDEVLQTAIHPVFQGGNVVLSGTQGCGKTMILSLLRPETRIAYYKCGREFPVNKKMRNFVSAGINLTRSRITDLVQVSLGESDEVDVKELPYYFADFFNYLIVDDIIKSVATIGDNLEVFDGIVDTERFEEFAKLLSKQDCWFGALDGVSSLEQLKHKINERIQFYRRWVNGNLADDTIFKSIQVTKTNIGEPIARAAECLRQSGMISDEVPVLIRVDQIEELHRAYSDRQKLLLLSFRKMINRTFAARDARVHYRAGTRRYGWRTPEFLNIWGSEARLEERRDYLLVDMDSELFTRGETNNSIFEKFATDTFLKRIEYYYDDGEELSSEIIKTVFGVRPTAAKRLSQLNFNARDEQIDRALALDISNDLGSWNDEWRVFLRNIYREGHNGILNATLAAAWGRQTGGGNKKSQHRDLNPPENEPWIDRKWWRKERLNQAVLQVTTRCQQRYMWWGFKDLISLSGGNITIFLHVCHRVWDAFLKSQSTLPEAKLTNIFAGGEIDKNIQSSGILFASNEWFNKLPEEPAGNSRQSFVEKLGISLNTNMMDDLSMSYPGGNGISIALNDYNDPSEENVRVREFLQDLIDFGVLYSVEHSSKTKSGGKRRKFYLHPILCPRFQLPESRTKEPYYWKMTDLMELIKKAKITLPKQRPNEIKQKTKGKVPPLNDFQSVFNFGDESL
jgi:hypothetical protein